MKQLEVVDYSQLLILPRSPKKVIDTFPEVRFNQEGRVLIPWDYNNAAKLASIGEATMSPIVRDFEFPGKFSPMKHQVKVAAFMSLYRRAYCFADMGTGKTASIIWATEYLMRLGIVKKVLVVCPYGIMETAWASELFRLLPSRPYIMLHHPNSAKRRELAAVDRPWHIINFDGIETILNELLANKYDLIIIDESTAYKTHTTKRWKYMNRLVKPETMVWALTGAPTPNSPVEAYGQGKLVTPWNVKNISFSSFKAMTMTKLSEYRWVPSSRANEIVKQVLQPAVRIRKADCLKDLPPVVIEQFKVKNSPEQEKLLSELRREWTSKIDEYEITAANAGVLLSKILQICTGAVFDANGVAIQINAHERVKVVLDLIERASKIEATDGKVGGKTLLFVPFRPTLELLRRELSTKYKVGVINGDIDPTERSAIYAKFQETDEIDIIIATPSSMSHGVTATAANTIIWYGPIMSGETYLQACNRMDRPGQTQKMLIAQVYSTAIEKARYAILEGRKETQEDLLQMYQDFLRGE